MVLAVFQDALAAKSITIGGLGPSQLLPKISAASFPSPRPREQTRTGKGGGGGKGDRSSEAGAAAARGGGGERDTVGDQELVLGPSGLFCHKQAPST